MITIIYHGNAYEYVRRHTDLSLSFISWIEYGFLVWRTRTRTRTRHFNTINWFNLIQGKFLSLLF